MAERKAGKVPHEADLTLRFRQLYMKSMENEENENDDYWYKRLIVRKYLGEIF